MATIPLVLLRTNEQRGIGDIVNEAAVAAGSDAPRYVVPFPVTGSRAALPRRYGAHYPGPSAEGRDNNG